MTYWQYQLGNIINSVIQTLTEMPVIKPNVVDLNERFGNSIDVDSYFGNAHAKFKMIKIKTKLSRKLEGTLLVIVLYYTYYKRTYYILYNITK